MPYHTIIDATGLRGALVRAWSIESKRNRIYLAQFTDAGQGGRLDVCDVSGAASYRICQSRYFTNDRTRRRLGFPQGVLITSLDSSNARYRAYSAVGYRPRGVLPNSGYYEHTGYVDLLGYRYIAFEFSVTQTLDGLARVADQCYWYSSIFGPAAPPPRDVSRYTFEPDRPQE